MTEKMVMVPIDPVISNKMKANHIGEYSWTEDCPYYDENGALHNYTATRTVPWDLCKEIFKRMYADVVAEEIKRQAQIS